ncbi:MAG: class I SAM-dependent methyltransferase [Chthoniobacteraceae bacterium]
MSFDRLAPHYRWMEAVLAGRKLQRCRVAWLDEVRDCRRVLIVGVGPGRFLESALHEMRAAEFVCVDASAAMLDRARAAAERTGQSARVRFIHASLPEWEPECADFDLIVTHFFLDCFPEPTLSQVVARLAAAAKPDAHWLLADFQIPARGVARLRARVVLALAYAFFRITTRLPAKRLVAPDDALQRSGFRLRHRRITDWGLLHSDVWTRTAACAARPAFSGQ